jgi:hypothetical protein
MAAGDEDEDEDERALRRSEGLPVVALWNLAAYNEDSKVKVAGEGGIGAILRAMQTSWPSFPLVFKRGAQVGPG